MRKIISAMLMAVMVMSLLTGCQGAEDNGKTTVRIGYFPNITHAQAMVVKSQNLLADKLGETGEVTWTSFNAGPAEVTALFAEEIDIGYIGPVPAISANVNSNGDIGIIAGASQGGAELVVNKNSTISDVKGLQGKTVAIPQLGNTQHISLLDLLKKNGLTVGTKENQVNVVAVANSEVQVLMEKNEIDAALVPEPWGSTLEGNGVAKVLLDYNQIGDEGKYPVALVVVRKAFQEEHPEIVEKFLESHKEATVLLNDNADEMQKVVNEEIKAVTGSEIKEDILKKAFSRMMLTTDITEESVMSFAQINKDEGFISTMPKAGIVDTSVLDGLK